MAIANGTCVSFCIQPKAHFGLPWVRPWDNRGKCHMNEKRIQCLSKHRSIYPSIFNRFPVIQPVSSNVRHFSTFFAHFGLPWVRPWDNRGKCYIDGMESGYNAGQTHNSIYPSIFNRLRAIEQRDMVGNCDFFLYLLTFNAPVWVFPLEFWKKSLVIRKLESLGYQAVKTV